MVNAHIDTLELELRKLDGVHTVGFSSQHDVLYIQLFIDANAQSANLPFEATRIAQRHSSTPVAVELVRWTDVSTTSKPSKSGLSSIFENTQAAQAITLEEQNKERSLVNAGSIGKTSNSSSDETQTIYDDSNDIREEPLDYAEPEQDGEINDANEAVEPFEIDALNSEEISNEEELNEELNLASEELFENTSTEDLAQEDEIDKSTDERREDNSIERIALLLVTTSPENDEIEVHLSFDELRTIGRAGTNRGLLGAIDATVEAIAELTGTNEFHAEWARSLEPGAEHASLVAVGLTNKEGTDTRHGIAGGSSPIEAAARATLNALNRTAILASLE